MFWERAICLFLSVQCIGAIQIVRREPDASTPHSYPSPKSFPYCPAIGKTSSSVRTS